MTKDEIIEKIKNALKRCSINYGIEPQKVRIKLGLKSGLIGNGIKITIMNGVNDIEEVSLKNILDLNMLESTFVTPILVKKISDKASQYKVDKERFNARIYTKEDNYEPSLYIFDDTKGIKELTINEIL